MLGLYVIVVKLPLEYVMLLWAFHPAAGPPMDAGVPSDLRLPFLECHSNSWRLSSRFALIPCRPYSRSARHRASLGSWASSEWRSGAGAASTSSAVRF